MAEREALADDVRPMRLMVCGLCRLGEGGECHSPGCSFYLNRAPDLPLSPVEEPSVANPAVHLFMPDWSRVLYVLEHFPDEHGHPLLGRVADTVRRQLGVPREGRDA